MSQYTDTIPLSRSVSAGTVSKQAHSTSPKRVLIAVLAWPFKVLLKWQAHEMQRHEIARLDQHLMRDVGMTEADVEQMLAKPFWKTHRR